MSIKSERLGNVLLKEISNILMTEVRDKDINFVTVTHVDLSTDLTYAKVYCTVLDESKKDKALHDLNEAKGFIKSMLAKRKIEMRVIPELKFIYDESIDYGNRIENIIKEIQKEE